MTSRNPATVEVLCNGAAVSGNIYNLMVSRISKDGSVQVSAAQNGREFFSGPVKLFQQAKAIDPKTGKKAKMDSYWDRSSDKIRIKMAEENLMTTSLLSPEVAELSCQ